MREKQQQQVIIVPTCNILNPCLNVIVIKYIHDMPRSVCNINQPKQDLQRHHKWLNDSDNNYIIDEIGRRDKIEYKRNIRVEDDE